jgi:hypothetical protein
MDALLQPPPLPLPCEEAREYEALEALLLSDCALEDMLLHADGGAEGDDGCGGGAGGGGLWALPLPRMLQGAPLALGTGAAAAAAVATPGAASQWRCLDTTHGGDCTRRARARCVRARPQLPPSQATKDGAHRTT